MIRQIVASRLSPGLILVPAVFGLMLVSHPATAQTLYGSVVGNVKDDQGGGVPGANVTLVNTGSNLKREDGHRRPGGV